MSCIQLLSGRAFVISCHRRHWLFGTFLVLVLLLHLLIRIHVRLYFANDACRISGNDMKRRDILQEGQPTLDRAAVSAYDVSACGTAQSLKHVLLSRQSLLRLYFPFRLSLLAESSHCLQSSSPRQCGSLFPSRAPWSRCGSLDLVGDCRYTGRLQETSA